VVCLQTFRAQLKIISGSIRSDISERAMKLVHLSLLLQGNSFVAAFSGDETLVSIDYHRVGWSEVAAQRLPTLSGRGGKATSVVHSIFDPQP